MVNFIKVVRIKNILITWVIVSEYKIISLSVGLQTFGPKVLATLIFQSDSTGFSMLLKNDGTCLYMCQNRQFLRSISAD